MRNAELSQDSELIRQMEAVYGRFDLGPEGYPTPGWENRNLRSLRLPEMLVSEHFKGACLIKVRINRRMMGALQRTYLEICTRWQPGERAAHGLNRFVKCYAFGDGGAPNLFWYGAAWELSPSVAGAELDEVIQMFRQQGFKHDRKRLRVLEYW
jgi:hypothetical protein